MTTQPGISRRHMLAMSAASLAVGGIGGVSAQQLTKRIDQFDPALEKIIATSEPINELASGLGGPLIPGQRPHAEGPVWWKEGGYLLFTDVNASKRMKTRRGMASACSRSIPTRPTASPAISKAGSLPARERPGA